MSEFNHIDREIEAIYCEPIGWVLVNNDNPTPIEIFYVNGEMASLAWFRKGNEEFNGKYVQYVRYRPKDD